MLQVGYGKVARKDGEGVHQYLVMFPEGDAFLLGWQVGRAEETATFADGLCVDLGTRRYDTGGVELHFVAYAAHAEFLDLYATQGLVVVAGRGPVG